MPNWFVASTVHAPYWLVILHAKYHLGLGASAAIYFLDQPDKYSPEEKSLMSDCATIVLCDQDYWNARGGRPEKTTYRQSANLLVAREICRSDWLLHIDIDEFLYASAGGIEDLLSLPEEISEVRLDNVERVLTIAEKTWCGGYFRIKRRGEALLKKHYGSKSVFFGLGLANYFHGKSFVKARSGIIQNIHGSTHEDVYREVIRYQATPQEAIVVHYPCITPSHFISRYLEFLTRGGPVLPEFKHQRIFRAHLVSEARKHGPLPALLKGMKDLHYCSDEQAEERLADGLYERMPQAYMARIRECAIDPHTLDLGWADRSFAGYLGLLRNAKA